MTASEKSGIQKNRSKYSKTKQLVIFSSMNRKCPTHYTVHTFLLWTDRFDDQNSYNQNDRQNRSYNKCDSNSIILPSNTILSSQYKGFSSMEGSHLEVVCDGEVQRFSFSEFFSLQSSIQLAELRNSSQTHPHDKVLVFYTTSVIIRLGDIVCPVHRYLLIRLITTHNNVRSKIHKLILVARFAITIAVMEARTIMWITDVMLVQNDPFISYTEHIVKEGVGDVAAGNQDFRAVSVYICFTSAIPLQITSLQIFSSDLFIVDRVDVLAVVLFVNTQNRFHLIKIIQLVVNSNSCIYISCKSK